VRKSILLTTAFCLSVAFALVPVAQAGSKTADNRNTTTVIETVSENEARENSVLAMAKDLYHALDLEDLGLSFSALEYAFKGYEYLKEQGYLNNDNILTVIDFSQSSRKKRMYIIDMEAKKLLVNTYVAHGRNSGLDYATKFSNKLESLQSSLGFYVTKGTYMGKHGLSLRLSGKDKGFNDMAEPRAVVVHGADYIGSHRSKASYNGRSFGCPAVPSAESKKIINLIKDGSCMFIYHPSENYFNKSKILNS
jgi:hypothetical protein